MTAADLPSLLAETLERLLASLKLDGGAIWMLPRPPLDQPLLLVRHLPPEVAEVGSVAQSLELPG